VAGILHRAREQSGRAPSKAGATKSERKPRARRLATDSGEGPAAWKAGDKVVHPKFGHGIVVSAEPDHDDWKVTVAFKDGGGVKKLLAGTAKLEKR